mmetsp:Transcript_20973/g.69964  ORF Transcript_20973/g.69964 Transcript_20973/m.69964 type:complete len:114 (+) Transcript_20973:194-535(+)
MLRGHGHGDVQNEGDDIEGHDEEDMSAQNDVRMSNEEGLTVVNFQGCPPEVLSRIRVEILQENEGEDCSICLSTIFQGNLMAILPCSHRFHEQCVLRWLNQSRACPYCRSRIS